MPENAEDEAAIARTILSALDSNVRRLLETDEGRKVARLSAAYTALTGQAPPPWPVLTEMPSQEPASAASRNGSTPSGRGPSLRQRVQEIIDEAPRQWTYDTMVSELERRGHTLTGSDGDPKSALRTAVWWLKNHNEAVREAGKFWSAKFDAELRAPAEAGSQDHEDEDPFADDPFADPFPPQVARRSKED